MPTTLDRLINKRDSIKTIDQLAKFLRAEMVGFAFSVSFPNGDSRMGTGSVSIFINAPSQYTNVRPIYQVGDDDTEVVSKTMKALPRLLNQVREIESIAEAERMEGIIHGPGKVRNISQQRPSSTKEATPPVESSFPQRAAPSKTPKKARKQGNRNPESASKRRVPNRGRRGMTAAEAEAHRVQR